MSEQFTNRRGHSLIIDDEEVTVVEPAINTQPTPQRRQRRLKVHVWRWVALAVVCAVLVVIAVFEVVRFGYATSVESARRDIQTLVTNDVAAAAKQAPLSSETIGILRGKFKDVSMSLCPGGLLDNYASLYPRSKHALDACTQYRTKVEALVTALGLIADEARYLEALEPVVTSLVQPLPDKFAVISSQQESWRLAVVNLKDITPPLRLQSVHYVLVERVTAVAGAWTNLAAASNAQDSSKYREVRDQLPGMYAAIRVLADELETSLSSAQTQLSTAYEALK